MKGPPGAVLDEDFSEAEGSYLYYAYYNEKGRLTYYADFKRNISPEEISEILNDYADELLCHYPEKMTVEEVIEKVNDLRIQAQNVPGLRAK
ncbi:hypothetical protein A2394_02575 [Candidatus Woesebacteria bacterium RIFOXYB1_FULL_42_36]|nr:MAG: hypothetical protein A2208_00175 [Candidatus Woesebacteria bacterium RIFOXYA1_FULL_43_16]OGM81808.1 MAG: hypothetical protein A2394_02575 [Candidatus Woesebacteria bacterium RIFOXYB1_FULL_42_36]